MGKLLGSLALSILVGCGGGLEGKVDDSASRVDVLGVGSAPHGNIDASINSVEVSDAGSKVSHFDYPCYLTSRWLDIYYSIRGRVLDYGLKTNTMKRIYEMAENQINLSKKFYNNCDDPNYLVASIYGVSAINWILELDLQQGDFSARVVQKPPTVVNKK